MTSASTTTTTTPTTPTSTTVHGGTQGTDPDEPMSLFEKRRLIARLQQDPRTVQRMTPRERREVAAMAKALEKDKDQRRD